MKPIESSCQASPEATDEPLKLGEALGATAIVVAACAAVAIAFTTLAAAHVTRDAFKRLFRKGGAVFNDRDNGVWHQIFNLCANSLHWLAGKLDPIWPGGMDYVKLNVILFCIVLPLVFLASLYLNLAFLLG